MFLWVWFRGGIVWVVMWDDFVMIERWLWDWSWNFFVIWGLGGW